MLLYDWYRYMLPLSSTPYPPPLTPLPLPFYQNKSYQRLIHTLSSQLYSSLPSYSVHCIILIPSYPFTPTIHHIIPREIPSYPFTLTIYHIIPREIPSYSFEQPSITLFQEKFHHIHSLQPYITLSLEKFHPTHSLQP